MAKGKYADWLGADGLLLVEAWARDGLTEEQIAHNMGITRETLRVWKNKFPAISSALKKGKEVVDRSRKCLAEKGYGIQRGSKKNVQGAHRGL